MSYVLIIFMSWSSEATPLKVGSYSGIVACEAAGAVWDTHLGLVPRQYKHHVCVPAP